MLSFKHVKSLVDALMDEGYAKNLAKPALFSQGSRLAGNIFFFFSGHLQHLTFFKESELDVLFARLQKITGLGVHSMLDVKRGHLQQLQKRSLVCRASHFCTHAAKQM